MIKTRTYHFDVLQILLSRILKYNLAMDKSHDTFQSPFMRPSAAQMAASPRLLPSQKSLKGIIAGNAIGNSNTSFMANFVQACLVQNFIV